MKTSLWIDLRDFFFPRRCLGCGEKLHAGEDGLCLKCFLELSHTQFLNTRANEMECRLWFSSLVCRASSVFYYTKGGLVAMVLQGMKYQGRKNLCRRMGSIMAVELLPTGFFDGIDCLIPVPLHPARMRQRGYNQSEWLARGIQDKTNIPIASDVLVRTHNNTTQTHKSSSERWQSAQNLFALTPRSNSLAYKHVLLIDDVFTTGATLAACIDRFSSVEGIHVSVLTLAYAK